MDLFFHWPGSGLRTPPGREAILFVNCLIPALPVKMLVFDPPICDDPTIIGLSLLGRNHRAMVSLCSTWF
ncbi:MAG TPA: hypothetical protein VIR61_03485, partial [Sulfuricaulis sp.]